NNTDTVYETNELIQIRAKVAELVEQITGKKTDSNENSLTAFRVLTDHSRSAVFALSDGILPDNTGRGYVVRRIIRRALLFAHHLGVQQPILHKLHSEIVSIYGGFYPELKDQQAKVLQILLAEEQRFLTTLETGVRKYDEFLSESKSTETGIFSGKQAFILYDTFGFPLEMTIELAERHGLKVDITEFEKHMQDQRDLARQQSNWKDFKLPPNWSLNEEAKSDFVGYDTLHSTGNVIGIICADKSVTQSSVGDELMIALSVTPFYPEGGGQLGDTGYLNFADGRIRVDDTQKKGSLIFHIGKVEQGRIQVGDSVEAIVDNDRRNSLIRHHSATHLLNSGLRSVLGNHILQTGSLVSPDYLRFDFSHSKRLSSDELQKVEESVIEAIQAKATVTAVIMPIEEAKKTGAIATFGEKYGEQVRVLSMKDNNKEYSYSVEFCGGCHVRNTSDIKLFHIIKESSPGAGNRRIEAVAGDNVIQYFANQFSDLQHIQDRLLIESSNLQQIHSELKSIPVLSKADIQKQLSELPKSSLQLENELDKLRNQFKDFEKKIRKLAQQANHTDNSQIDTLLKTAKNVGKFKLVVAEIKSVDANGLKALADRLREKESKVIFLTGSVSDKGPTIVYSCTNEAVKVGLDCSELIRQTSIHIDGKGGGKKDMAQAGGKNQSGIKQALAAATRLVESKLAQ
ncbi:MAG: alanine--tRNA ligase, partial [Leptonema sp. (in: Bacteria)]|nr:alanine--tRNA ligase [Leptonema sp. (in: bacteria)]